MTQRTPRDTDPTADTLDEWINLYLDGTISPEQIDLLQNRLREDAEARSRLVNESAIHAGLRDPELFLRQPRNHQAHSPLARLTSSPWAFAIVTLTALTLLTTLVLHKSDQTTISIPGAVVTSTVDDIPLGPLHSPIINVPTSGFVEVKMSSGARFAIDGGGKVELISEDRIRLINGNLGAHVPNGTEGFTVETPSGEITDLGTSFGVSVDKLGNARAEVFDGEIQIRTDAYDESFPVDATIALSHEGTIATLKRMADADAFPMPQHTRVIQVARGDFEQGSPFNIAVATNLPPGTWGGDACKIVGTTLGITPHHGSGMLQMVSSSSEFPASENVSCNVVQWIDLAPYLRSTQTGVVDVDASIFVNRIPGSDDTDTAFTLAIECFSEFPEDYTNNNRLKVTSKRTEMLSDGDINTWERLAISSTVDPRSRYLRIDLGSYENVIDDQTGPAPEFAGHFVDTIEMRLIFPARPAIASK